MKLKLFEHLGIQILYICDINSYIYIPDQSVLEDINIKEDISEIAFLRFINQYFPQQNETFTKRLLNNKRIKSAHAEKEYESNYTLCIHPSRKCNLQCKYCFGEEEYLPSCEISLDMAIQAIDFIVLNHGVTGSLYTIDLSGSGEPLLRLDFIKELDKHCETLRNKTGKVESRGEVLWNYMQAQLFVINKSHLFVTEDFKLKSWCVNYVIPYIGYSMESNKEFFIKQDKAIKYIDSAIYKYYSESKEEIKESAKNILHFITSILGLIHIENENMSFTHQYFRDVSASIFYYTEANKCIAKKESSYDLYGMKWSQPVRELFFEIIADEIMRAAETNNNVIYNLLGDVYYYGVKAKSISINQNKAFLYLEKSADNDDFYGAWSVGYYYRQGDIVDPDFQQAIKYTLKALDKKPNYGPAVNTLATLFLNLAMILHKIDNVDEFGMEIHKYTELIDMIDGLDYNNMDLNNPNERREIVEVCLAFAKAKFEIAGSYGFLESYNRLGQIYDKGQVGQEVNKVEAFKYYKLSADKGEPWAQNRVGLFYKNGTIKIENALEKAFDYFKKSGAQDNSYALFNMAHYYKKGLTPCEKDEIRADGLYEASFELANIDAGIMLIDIHLERINALNNFDSKLWINEKADKNMNSIVEHMSAFDRDGKKEKIDEFYLKLKNAKESIR